MKVLHINAVSGIRSTGRICAEIIESLHKDGHKGYIAYADGKRQNKIGNKFDRMSALSRINGNRDVFL